MAPDGMDLWKTIFLYIQTSGFQVPCGSLPECISEAIWVQSRWCEEADPLMFRLVGALWIWSESFAAGFSV